MTEKRTAVKVGLTPDENAHITRQAQALGMDRSTLMRLRALGDPAVSPNASAAPLTLKGYHRAVQAAVAASRGCAPRPIIESIAAAVIASLYAKTKITQNPPAGIAQTDG